MTEPNWLPIETAEKDTEGGGSMEGDFSTTYLLGHPDWRGGSEGFWHHGWQKWCYQGDNDQEIYDPQPTHWMPVPPPVPSPKR